MGPLWQSIKASLKDWNVLIPTWNSTVTKLTTSKQIWHSWHEKKWHIWPVCCMGPWNSDTASAFMTVILLIGPYSPLLSTNQNQTGTRLTVRGQYNNIPKVHVSLVLFWWCGVSILKRQASGRHAVHWWGYQTGTLRNILHKSLEKHKCVIYETVLFYYWFMMTSPKGPLTDYPSSDK